MSRYTFDASRISGDNNVVFPDRLIIDTDDNVVIHKKQKLIGSKETRIRFDAIASVVCDKHVLFADIIIETRGSQQIIGHGFSRPDADRIKELLSF